MSERPRYRTWIRARAIVVFAVLTGLSLLGLAGCAWTPWALLAGIPAASFGWILLVISLSSYRFSERGGGLQRRIHGLIVERARGERALDIGCGNGPLTIRLAQADRGRVVTGLDAWGDDWEYSRRACERNAAIEGVEPQVSFVRGSASRLPFPDASFDCVVSCLTFHEVRDIDDRTRCLDEALRVLRPGGRFVFLDLFADLGAFPEPTRIAGRIAARGGQITEERRLAELVPLPFPLRGRRVLGHARLIAGTGAPQGS